MIDSLRAQVRQAVKRGDIAHAVFLCGIIVLLPKGEAGAGS